MTTTYMTETRAPTEEPPLAVNLTWPKLDVLSEESSQPESLDSLIIPPELETIPEDQQGIPPEILNIVQQSLEHVKNLIAEARVTAADNTTRLDFNDTERPELAMPEPLMSGALHSDEENTRSSGEGADNRIEVGSTASGDANSTKHTESKLSKLKPRLWKNQARASHKGRHDGTKQENGTVVECTSCFDEIPRKKATALHCRHHYCQACFQQLIATAMNNEAQFPPKCCLTPIPMKTILSSMDSAQRLQYKMKAEEYATQSGERIYCPNAACARWISHQGSSSLWKSPNIRCPYCTTSICVTCRSTHSGVGQECPGDYGLAATIAFAVEEGWRRCRQCRAIVELTEGCRHMTCKCGAQFCYTCGAVWRTCSCTEADEAIRKRRIREAKEERHRQATREEREIAEAIAQVEEAERREAAERERLERVIALEEEARRREAAERAEKHRCAVLSSITSRHTILRHALSTVNSLQVENLNAHHITLSSTLLASIASSLEKFTSDAEMLTSLLSASHKTRFTNLEASYAATRESLKSAHESQEDETFCSLQLHMRGKPDREVRIESVMAQLRNAQAAERNDMEDIFVQKKARIGTKLEMERQALEEGLKVRRETEVAEDEDEKKELVRRILAERAASEMLLRRRAEMLEAWRVAAIERDVILAADGLERRDLPPPPAIIVHPAPQNPTDNSLDTASNIPGAWIDLSQDQGQRDHSNVDRDQPPHQHQRPPPQKHPRTPIPPPLRPLSPLLPQRSIADAHLQSRIDDTASSNPFRRSASPQQAPLHTARAHSPMTGYGSSSGGGVWLERASIIARRQVPATR